MSFQFRLCSPHFAARLATIKPQRYQARIGRRKLPNRFVPKSDRFTQTLATISPALEEP
jgi:hypothetical protein